MTLWLLCSVESSSEPKAAIGRPGTEVLFHHKDGRFNQLRDSGVLVDAAHRPRVRVALADLGLGDVGALLAQGIAIADGAWVSHAWNLATSRSAA